MNDSYLEVTFQHGSVLAAYYYLPREAGQKSARCERIDGGLVIDFDAQGQPIGIEITAPSQVTVESFNRVLKKLGQPPVGEKDLKPLEAA